MPRAVFTSTGASSAVGYYQFFTDWREGLPAPNITVGVVPTTSNATFNAEWTLDYTGSSTFTSSLANWFISSQITGATSAQYANITWPVTAVRLNVTAYSSSPSVTMTVLQSG